jgi:hypothetical protein
VKKRPASTQAQAQLTPPQKQLFNRAAKSGSTVLPKQEKGDKRKKYVQEATETYQTERQDLHSKTQELQVQISTVQPAIEKSEVQQDIIQNLHDENQLLRDEKKELMVEMHSKESNLRFKEQQAAHEAKIRVLLDENRGLIR